MSIELSLSVYGPQLATALAGDPEELSYFFKTLSEDYSATDLGEEIADYIHDPELIAEWLQELARAIEANK